MSKSEVSIDESSLVSVNSATNDKIEDANQSVVEEEEGECGLCLWMKGGGCKESFVAWDKCLDEAKEKNEDPVSKCGEMTSLLIKCMKEHSDYYEPLLRAEKAVEEEAVKLLEKETDEAAVEKFAEESG